MKRFSRGDLVTVGDNEELAVVKEVILYDNQIKYLILNIKGEHITIKGEKIKEVVKIRSIPFYHG